MKKWIAILVVVLSAAAHSATAQEPVRRGEFEPPVQLPAAPETTIPAPTTKPSDAAPTGLPPVDSKPDKTILPPPMPDPAPKAPETAFAASADPAGACTPGCSGCQASCQRSCCAKLAAWFCHHRERTPDCCYRIDHRDAPVYTYFLDHPCRDASITAPGPTTSCECKKASPFFFGQLLGNGNLCCH